MRRRKTEKMESIPWGGSGWNNKKGVFQVETWKHGVGLVLFWTPKCVIDVGAVAHWKSLMINGYHTVTTLQRPLKLLLRDNIEQLMQRLHSTVDRLWNLGRQTLRRNRNNQLFRYLRREAAIKAMRVLQIANLISSRLFNYCQEFPAQGSLWKTIKIEKCKYVVSQVAM